MSSKLWCDQRGNFELPFPTRQALVYRNYSSFVAYSGRAQGEVPMAIWSPGRFTVELGSGPDKEPPMKLGF